MKIKLDTSDPTTRAQLESAERAKAEIEKWPDWKRGSEGARSYERDLSERVSICADCIYAHADGRHCTATRSQVAPRRLHPVTGDWLPAEYSYAVCYIRNAKGDCTHFASEKPAVFGHVQDLDDWDSPPSAPPDRRRGGRISPNPTTPSRAVEGTARRGFWAWLFARGDES